MEGFAGGCLCGDVRVAASGPPYRVGICHCLDCRKHHGALFQAFAIFPADAVTIVGQTGEYAGRHFCPRCGSSLYSCSGDEIEVNLGSLDAPDQLSPPMSSGPSAVSLGSRSFQSKGDMSATVNRRAVPKLSSALNVLLLAERRFSGVRDLDPLFVGLSALDIAVVPVPPFVGWRLGVALGRILP